MRYGSEARAKSSLGKVNAGVDCECFQGLAKEIPDQEALAATADEQEEAGSATAASLR